MVSIRLFRKMELFISIFLGDSAFQFSKDVWNKLFQFSTLYNAEDRTLRLIGQFTRLGRENYSR
jgi:hypothetical protein